MSPEPKLPTPADREGLELEFKGAEKLRSSEGRRDLVRTVVAMRNAEGGRIWVGCHEKDGRWNGLDPLEAGDRRHRDALRNQIVDSIEPLIALGSSVRLEELQQGAGWILAISVEKGEPDSAPCCARFGNQREFLRRTDDRNALIPFPGLQGKKLEDSRLERAKVLDLLDARCAQELDGIPSLTLLFLPETSSPGSGLHAKLRGVLESPDPFLDPVQGRGWFAGEYREVQKTSGRLRSGKPNVDLPYRVLLLERDGAFFFYTHVNWIRSGQRTNADLDPILQGDDWPPQGWLDETAITATVVSLTRLAGRIAEQLGTRRGALAVSLQNAEGWGLRIVGSTIEPKAVHSPAVPAVVVRSLEDLSAAPDRVALDLLRELYDQVVDPGARELQATDFPWFQADGSFAPPQ